MLATDRQIAARKSGKNANQIGNKKVAGLIVCQDPSLIINAFLVKKLRLTNQIEFFESGRVIPGLVSMSSFQKPASP